MSKTTVVTCLKELEKEHLLKIERRGRKNYYVARERVDVRLGSRLLCTVVVDYVPATLRATLSRIKGAATEELSKLSDCDIAIIPGPGFSWDETAGKLVSSVLTSAQTAAGDEKTRVHKERLRQIRNEIARSGRIAA